MRYRQFRYDHFPISLPLGAYTDPDPSGCFAGCIYPDVFPAHQQQHYVAWRICTRNRGADRRVHRDR